MRVSERVIIGRPATINVIEKIVSEKDESQDRIIVRGRLISGDDPTRNGVAYTAKSLGRIVKLFNDTGKTIPFLDTHDDSSIRKSPPFGHVIKLFMEGNDVMYEADIDPEEKMFIRKVRRGDIKEVSLQAIVDQVDEKESLDTGDNYIVADVRELLEISSVLIPGARNTTMQFMERMGIITEKTFVERLNKFKTSKFESYKSFKESLRKEQELIGGNERPSNNPEDNPELVGDVSDKEEKKEDINTGNSDALIRTKLPKEIKVTKNKLQFVMKDGRTREKANVRCVCGTQMIKESFRDSFILSCNKCKKKINK